MRYLNGTQDLYLTVEVDDKGIIEWSVDAAFAVHSDMKSHTAGTMSMGNGSLISRSSKQKLNTKSSTEAELVATDDMSGHIMWTKYFLEEQGYDFKTVLLQDNKSAVLLLENSRVIQVRGLDKSISGTTISKTKLARKRLQLSTVQQMI